MTSRLRTISLGLSLGCGADSAAATADDGKEATSVDDDGSTGSAGATSGGDEARPTSCPTDETLFASAECLDALRERCLENTAEASCSAVNVVPFGPTLTVRCSWVKVVTFSDEASCTVASVQGRCEANVDEIQSGCSDACAGEYVISSLSAFPTLGEIVEMCGGPLGRWAAIGGNEDGFSGSCAPNVTPPAPPLCDCAPVACEAE